MNLTWPRPGELAWCGGTFTAVLLRIVRIVLTVAHLNHTPEDCRDENLKALCQRCHNRYDAAERRRGMRSRAHAARAAGDFFSG
jgi:5-methylcytosine-specific restriction endonuclease McrA